MSPSPPGKYWFAGRYRRYDYGRIVTRLGRQTDVSLGREISAPTREVWRLRQELGIPRYDALRGLESLLGVYTDGRLAREAGCAIETVRHRRRQLGIPRANVRRAHANEKLAELIARLREEIRP